jgi:hypothetical protein
MPDRRTFLKEAMATAALGLHSRWDSGLGATSPTLQSADEKQAPLISNLREATISVADFEESVNFYHEQFGYDVALRVELKDDVWRKLWRLPPDTTAQVAILRSSRNETGAFRIVQFSPTSKILIRVPYRPLETSFVGCDMPTRDVAGRFNAITGQGWAKVSSILTFHSPKLTQPVTVAVIIGPTGERLPLVSLTALQNDPKYSQVFKAHAPIYIAFQTTEDIERDTKLYTSLGLTVVRDRTFQIPELNRALGVAEDAQWRSLQVSHPDETFGRVGLVQYLNKRVHNISDRSDPPNLGLVMLSFRTRNMAETLARLKPSAASIMCEPTRVENALYGSSEVMTVKQPNGGWLEFYS